MRTLSQTARDLAAGSSARALVEECLVRIADPAGEGRRVFLKVHAEIARATADHVDHLRRRAAAPSRFAGIPVSIKDLFDIAGDVTTSASIALKDASPATADAVAVARLRAAGLIPIGRTNMTEFAFTGLGINPHYDTPRNPYDRATGRLPGGSSSGAAVSVTDGMAIVALGTDTGGSCRIPAALCGIVGYKPTAKRIPLAGVLPLSFSLDSVGPLAPTVACCAAIDAVMAGEPGEEITPFPLRGLRLAAPHAVVLDDLDDHVSRRYEAALSALRAAGAVICDIPLGELKEIATLNARGGFAASEAYAWHRRLIEAKGALYDPRVLMRIVRGRDIDAADYIDLVRGRADLIRRVAAVTRDFDALVMPTVPITAPPLAELEAEDRYRKVNLLLLRNPTVANMLDRCAISVPCHLPGEAPVGLTLVGEHGGDRRLFEIAAAVETAVSPVMRHP
ncbi:MAG: amidase [Xanthobacteraceae bacterium]|nr:amidase [Xanthobacteraceae bacterium]